MKHSKSKNFKEPILKFVKTIFKIVFFLITLAFVGLLSAYITMNIIIGGKATKVPDLKGKDIKEALKITSRYELNLSISENKRYDDSIPPDHIIAQNPEAGSRIKKGRKIEVILSMGTEKIDCPSFIGQTERESVLLIQQLNLRIGHSSTIYNRTFPEKIIAQYPNPGTKLSRGTPIDLLVNKHIEPYYIMPDLIGKNLDEVINFFNKFTIRIGGIKIEEYPNLPSKVIIKQQPQIGFPFKPSEIISITISK